jgi:pimeloyl-ACP methyl ester carboxylesterase
MAQKIRILPRLAFIFGAFLLMAFGVFLASIQSWRAEKMSDLTEGSQLASLPSGPVEYIRRGDGPTVLVFHDAGGGYDAGSHLGGFLEMEGFEVIVISRPGYLRTPLSMGDTPRKQAEVAAALLDSLAIPVVAVVGEGFGAAVASEFAHLFPQRTTALVLVSAVTAPLNAPPLGSPTDYATMRFSQRPLADSLALAFDFTTIGTPEEKSTWVTSILDDPSQSEYFESLLDALIPTSPRAKGLQNDLLQAPTISLDHLKQIQTPTLIVHGQKDKLVPFAQAEAAASLMNHALFLPLPDAGHIIFLGNAARGAQARITEFLQNHIPSNSPSSR